MVGKKIHHHYWTEFLSADIKASSQCAGPAQNTEKQVAPSLMASGTLGGNSELPWVYFLISQVFLAR
jgi:hypothetical protein